MKRIPTAFLSSLFWEHKALRAELHLRARESGNRLWVAEIDRPDLITKPPLEVVDTLLREVREADYYICILGPHRHGSLVPVGGKDTNVSYFELEIFQAALLKKPMAVFATDDFNPDSRLASVINMLRFALPDNGLTFRLSPSGLIGEVMSALEARRRQPATPKARAWLTHILDVRRSASIGAAPGVGLQFLGGVSDTAGDLPDKDLIRSLLEEEEAVDHKEQKLGRLWLAARELLGAPYAEERYAEYRELWNNVLSRWSRAGSWYGLHAHLHLGVLAALKSQAHIRSLLRDSRGIEPSTVHPSSGLASAYYSIAGQQPTRRRKRLNYRKSLWHLEKGIKEGRLDQSVLLAIRGSVYLRLGHPWRACADYEEVVRLREAIADNPKELGEALSELGYGYLRAGKLLAGRHYLEKGVDLLAGGQGFLVRAKKKLAIAYAVTGHPFRAKKELEEARTIAEGLGIFDQI
jgi:tetratricopeptide (TPR) repeat protein